MAVSYSKAGKLILARLTSNEADAVRAFCLHAMKTARAGREAAHRALAQTPNVQQFQHAADYWDGAERFAQQLYSQINASIQARKGGEEGDDTGSA